MRLFFLSPRLISFSGNTHATANRTHRKNSPLPPFSLCAYSALCSGGGREEKKHPVLDTEEAISSPLSSVHFAPPRSPPNRLFMDEIHLSPSLSFDMGNCEEEIPSFVSQSKQDTHAHNVHTREIISFHLPSLPPPPNETNYGAP